MDEVVSHDEVLRWLPPAVQREWAEAERARVLALPPEERGWYTEGEVAASTRRFVAVQELSQREARYIPTD